MEYYTRSLFDDGVIGLPPRMECRDPNLGSQVAGVAICSRTGNYFSFYYVHAEQSDAEYNNYNLELDVANSHLDQNIKQTLWEF